MGPMEGLSLDSLTGLLLCSISMNDDKFEWDQTKARSNYKRHGVTFETARKAFADPYMVEGLDQREDYGEDRLLLTGMVEDELLSVIYTEREGRFRLISARRATKHEQDHYFTQNRQDEA
jgi:uncharacterized DUF497 family protein